MAATIINGPGVPVIRRSSGSQSLGTISAGGQAVAFTVPAVASNHNGFDTLVITTDGNLVATVPILEVSIDGGATFVGVVAPTNASSSTTFNLTLLTGDTAASTVNAYTIAGLQGGAIFRFGFNTFTSGSGKVWVMCS